VEPALGVAADHRSKHSRYLVQAKSDRPRMIQFQEAIHVVLSDKPPLDPSQELRKRELHQALSKLPFEFREILALCEIEGWSCEQLVSALRLPIDVVISRVSEARLCLRQEMTEVRQRGNRE
jgi:RNA polymerase sigma-70 factor (ECF subfamily)